MIYAFEELVAYHLWFALRDSQRYQVLVVRGVDVRTDDQAYFLPRGFNAIGSVQLQEIGEESIWLVFRTSKAGEDALLIESFTRRGYAACPAKRIGYRAAEVVWMEMTRAVGGCGRTNY